MSCDKVCFMRSRELPRYMVSGVVCIVLCVSIIIMSVLCVFVCKTIILCLHM